MKPQGHRLEADGSFIVLGDGRLVCAAQTGFSGPPRFLGRAGREMRCVMGAHDPVLSTSYADPYIIGSVAAAIMQVISKNAAIF